MKPNSDKQMKKILLLFTLIPVFLKAQLSGIANDCIKAIPICSNETYNTGTTVNQGSNCDITSTNRGCIGGTTGTSDPYSTGSPQEIFCRYEYSPTFFYFEIQTNGVLEFMAGNSGADLDFALYGPCTGTGLSDYCNYLRSNPPVRCNFNSSPGGGTGMINSGGGGPTSPISANLNVSSGQVYILLIQQWGFPPSPVGFDLLFNEGTGANDANSTCTFDCTILPIQLSEFIGWSTFEGIKLKWTSEIETATNNFVILKSEDSYNFEKIKTLSTNGYPSTYNFIDNDVEYNKNYFYQVVTYSQDGSIDYSEIISVTNTKLESNRKLLKMCDIFGKEVDENKSGIIIYIFDNGDVVKVLN